MKFIFLDIDGVFNPQNYEEMRGVASFYPEQVTLFNWLLNKHQDAKIVISSAWRYMVHNGSMTQQGFEELLRSHGIKCSGRLVGVTPKDVRLQGGDSQDIYDARAWSFSERGRQIEQFLKESEIPVTNMVVIDDAPMGMQFDPYEHVLVKTKGNVGLTREDVDKANKILCTPFQPSV